MLFFKGGPENINFIYIDRYILLWIKVLTIWSKDHFIAGTVQVTVNTSRTNGI